MTIQTRVIFAICYLILCPFIIGLLDGFDRKISARMQGRRGPSVLQPFFDLKKLFEKEFLTANKSQLFMIRSYLCFIVLSGIIFFSGFDLLLVVFSLSTAAMFLILDAMIRMLAPILAFTADEVWKSMPHRKTDIADNVMFNPILGRYEEYQLSDEKMAEYNDLISLRDDINIVLEEARASKLIGKPLEAKVVLYCDDNNYEKYSTISDSLAKIMIVSQVSVEKGTEGKACPSNPGVYVKVLLADGEKCERCWCYSEEVGHDHEHPTLCPRCASVVKNLE